MPVSPNLKNFLNVVHHAVLRVVELMPEDRLAYTPGDNCRPFKDIALHIAAARWRLSSLLLGKTDMPAHQFAADQVVSRDALVSALKESHERSRAMLDSITDDALKATYQTPRGEMSGDMILHVMMVHESDHHGNLTVLAKCCGVTPPDIPTVVQQLRAAQA